MKLFSVGKCTVLLLPILLAACGGGGGDTTVSVEPNPVEPIAGSTNGAIDDPQGGEQTTNGTSGVNTDSSAGTSATGSTSGLGGTGTTDSGTATGSGTTAGDSGSSGGESGGGVTDANGETDGSSAGDGSTGDSTAGENTAQLNIQSFTSSPEPAITDEAVSFSWVFETNSNDSLVCQLDVNLDGTADYSIDDCKSNGSVVHTYQTPGEYTAQLRITGASVPLSASTSAVLVERSNTPPTILSFAAAPTPVMVNDAVEISWDIEDIDGDALVCSLDADGDGVEDYSISECNNDSTVIHFYGAPGDYTPQLTVTDPFGESDTKEAEAEVHVLPIMVKISTVTPAGAGTRAIFEVRVSNLSQTPVNNVRVSLRVPAGLSYDHRTDVHPNTSGCFTCADGSESGWLYPSLNAGASRIISINALISPDLIDNAIVSAPFTVSADGMLSQINISKDIVINNRLTSQLALSTESMAPTAGESFELDVTLGNLDSIDLTNASVRLVLPPGAFAESVTSADGAIEENSGDVVWNLGTAPVLQTQQRSVQIRVAPDATPGLILPMSATVKHDGNLESGRTSELSVPIAEDAPPLNLDVSMAQNPVVAGGRLKTRITISNTSLVPVRNIVLVHRVPPGITFGHRVDASPDADGCFTCGPNSEAFWSLPVLAAGESVTLYVNANVDTLLQGGTITSLPFTLSADGLLTSLHQRAVARIDNRARVNVITSMSANPVVAAEEVSVHVDVGNIHTQDLQDAKLVLELPAGFSLVSIDTEGGAVDGDTGAIIWNSLTSNVASVNRYSVRMVANSDVIAGEIKKFTALLDLPDTAQLDVISDAIVAISERNSPLQLDISTVEPAATPGQRLRYNFRLTNNGLIPINNIGLLLRVPEGLTYGHRDDATPDADGCFTCSEGSESVWRIASLPVGATQTIEVNSSVLDTMPRGSVVAAPISVFADALPFTIFRVHATPVK